MLVCATVPVAQQRTASVCGADLRTFSWSYHQLGIVATVRTERPSDTAWQRFLGTGPLALLPVRDAYSNVVWSTSLSEAARLQALSPQEFALEVNQVGRRLAGEARRCLWLQRLGDFAHPCQPIRCRVRA